VIIKINDIWSSVMLSPISTEWMCCLRVCVRTRGRANIGASILMLTTDLNAWTGSAIPEVYFTWRTAAILLFLLLRIVIMLPYLFNNVTRSIRMQWSFFSCIQKKRARRHPRFVNRQTARFSHSSWLQIKCITFFSIL